jgi:broad specificity phosphatase PhoE
LRTMRGNTYMLILVRHGQTEANAKGIIIGKSNHELNETGKSQAVQIAQSLIEFGEIPRVIVTSPLFRTVETAEIIKENLEAHLEKIGNAKTIKIIFDDRWQEQNYGMLDNTKLSEIPPKLWLHWQKDSNWKPAGGESLVELYNRVSAACEDIKNTASKVNVLVSTHVGPIKAAVAWALKADIGISWRLHVQTASISRIRTGPGGQALINFGEISHLVSKGD